MRRQRKFLGGSYPNPNLIIPLGKPPIPWFLYGVEVTDENMWELLAAHREGQQAGYQYAALVRASEEAERREHIRKWLASGKCLGAFYLSCR